MAASHTNICNMPFYQKSPQPPKEGVLNCHRHTQTQTDIAEIWTVTILSISRFARHPVYQMTKESGEDLYLGGCSVVWLSVLLQCWGIRCVQGWANF